MSVVFDVVVMWVSVILAVVYSNHRKDSYLVYSKEETTQYLLHPYFEKHQEKLFAVSLIALTLSTIFIQSIFQLFILILLIILSTIWAFNL